MKTIKLHNISLGLLALFALCNCTNSEGEPPAWSNYYILVDENGKDFFDNNSDYELNKLLGCTQIPDRCPISIFAEYDQQSMSAYFNSSHLLSFSAFTPFPIYLDFGNGDIDTLSWNWSPSNAKNENNYLELKTYSHIYNGKIVEKWEFQNRQEVNDWINGNISVFRSNFEEFEKMRVVKIVKKKNPIESD